MSVGGAQVDGAKRAASTFSAAARDLRSSTVAARATAESIGTLARARAPRRTGRLAGSITVRTEAPGASVGTSLRYAPFVNYGTRYMSARPFLTDAAERGAPVALAVFARSTQATMAQVKGA